MNTSTYYGEAVINIISGIPMRRLSWSDAELFVYAQVSNEVGIERIGGMSSMPEIVKERLGELGQDLWFTNQWVKAIQSHQRIAITSWTPTDEDVVAQDWVLA